MRRLFNSSGNARELLGIGADVHDFGPTDLKTRGLIQRVHFDRFRFRGKILATDFAECVFQNCSFEYFSSQQHFWNTGNTWEKCVFSNLVLKEMLSPACAFRECKFSNVFLLGYRPHGTRFEECVLENCTLSGFEPKWAGGKHAVRIGSKGVSVFFDRCIMDSPTFEACYFRYTAWSQCRIENPIVYECSFEEATADSPWWMNVPKGDPLCVKIRKMKAMIREKCGSGSVAEAVFEAFYQDYRCGKATKSDYGKYYNLKNIPLAEMDLICDAAVEIGTLYPNND